MVKQLAYGPTLAGSGICNELPMAECVGAEQCVWRKKGKKGGKKGPAKAHCAIKGARRVIKQKSAARSEAGMRAAAKNPWLQHLAMFRSRNPGMSYKDAMKAARQTYTPVARK